MKDNITTVINRGKTTWLRPYEVNGHKIEDIYIYKDGEIILHNRRSWFDCVDENFEPIYPEDLIEIEIDGKVKRANKVNLNRKDNYICKVIKGWVLNSGYSLFIYADNFLESYEELPKKYLGAKACTEDGRNTYLYGYKVKFKYPSKKHKMYFKYYNRGDILEEQDKGKTLHNACLTDNNGKIIRDSKGRAIDDPNTLYCSRFRVIEVKECVLYNGLYIKEGK